MPLLEECSCLPCFLFMELPKGFYPLQDLIMEQKNTVRVRESITTAIKYAALLATVVFIFLMVFPEAITRLFTHDAEVFKRNT